jgi:hypothetical protein
LPAPDEVDSERTEPTAASQPSTRETDDGAVAVAVAASQPADSQPATTAPSTTAPSTTAPSTTAPAVQPITIYWVGDLTVVPSALTALPKPLAPGDAEVELVATDAPVVLTRDGSKVVCARAAYRTDNTLAIDKSEKYPEIVLTHRQPAPDDDPEGDDGPETKLTTESVWYSFADRIATLKGKSRVTAPLESDRKDSSGVLDAAWRDEAKFRLVGERQDELTVERADFSGAVDVKAPQGKVKSEKLALLFDPPAPPSEEPGEKKAKKPQRGQTATQPFANAKQPDLRRIIATEKVSCALTDDREGTKTVDCDKLELETAKSDEDKLYPRVVEADGAVHASDGSQHLRAGHVVVKLKPAAPKGTSATTQPGEPAKDAEARADHVAPDPVDAGVDDPATTPPAAKSPAAATKPTKLAKAAGPGGGLDEKSAAAALESMLATDSVQVTSRDGAVATGDRLNVTTDDGPDQPHVELTGAPARVVDAKNGTLVSKTIVIDFKSGIAHVPGEGSLTTVQRDEKDPSKPGRPIEVSWADGADLDSGNNHIDVVGKVRFRITEPDRTVRTATAGRVGVQLVDKAPDEAAPGNAAGGNAATRPAKKRKASAPGSEMAGSMQADAMKNKEVGLVTLRDDAAVDSELLSADGKTVLQRFHLKSAVVQYDVKGRHLTVPGPGQMLVEDRSDPGGDEQAKRAKARAKADALAKNGDKGEGDGGGDIDSMAMNDGATAFQWSRRMEFEEAAGKATMDGSVVVTHQPDDKKEPPVRIDADQLIAEFVPEGADMAEAKSADGGAEQTAGANAAGAAGARLPRLKVKSFTAVGNILISRDGAELSAGRIDYDPSTEWVIARGNGRTPAAFTHPSGQGSATAGELWLNTRTWQVKVIDASTRAGVPTEKKPAPAKKR